MIVETGVVNEMRVTVSGNAESSGATPMAPSATILPRPLATKKRPLRIFPAACTSRSPPPTVVIASRAALAYQVVGRETKSCEMSPPASTETLPPTLMTPWPKLAKSIDELLPSAALPVCIHCHQYCAMLLPLGPLVTL